MQLLARSQEELKAAQARALQLENENVQLQARVSGEWGATCVRRLAQRARAGAAAPVVQLN